MFRPLMLGLLLGAGLAGTAFAQSCASYPYTLTNGATADASQVMADFNCAVLKGASTVGVGTSTPYYGVDVATTTATGGQGWSAFFREPGAGGVVIGSRGASTAAAVGAIMGVNTSNNGAGPLVLNPFGSNVGVGTLSPGATLDVQTSASGIVARFAGSSSSATNYIRVDSQYGSGYFGTWGNYPAILKDGVNWAYYFDTNDNISWLYGDIRNSGAIYPGSNGGNIAADAYTLYLRANNGVAFQNFGATTTWSYVDQAGIWANSFNNYSDARLKTNIQPLAGGLTLVDELRPVRYQFRAPADRAIGKALALPTTPQVGLIAQEVQAVVPEAVVTDKDGVNGINEAQLVPVLVDAIKELHGEVESLRAQFAAYQKAHP